MTFATVSDKYIKINNSGLLNDDAVLASSANYTEFTIALPNDATNIDKASYDIYLTELNLTSNFQSADVKWALVDVTDGVPSSLGTMTGGSATGSFSGVTANNLTLKAGLTINKGATKKYRLYVWLHNNPSAQQNGLLNGSLSAKVAFTARSAV